MAKKKVKPNGFSTFMHEFIGKERRAGRHHPKEDWAKVAKPHWDQLTPDQKEHYKQRAKAQPTIVKHVPAKYTSQGVPLDLVEREARELVEKQKYMERKVHSVVEDSFLENNINTRNFVFIMANYFYKTHDGIYSPAEIAAAKFNLENGIQKKYHTFVNPGTVEIGYAFEAKNRSEKVHRLPTPNTLEAFGDKSYERVYANILMEIFGVRPGQTFSKDDRNRPYVFTREQDVEMMESILDQLSDKQWRQTFDVFHLELLFNKLKNKVETSHGADPIRITVTNVFIEQDRFDATAKISCDFHEEQDVTRHCALSYVQRWFFLFTDHICEKIGIKLQHGIHLPENIALEPPQPFANDPFDDFNGGGAVGGVSNNRNRNGMKEDFDRASTVSSTYTGYSKLQNDSDSSDSDDY